MKRFTVLFFFLLAALAGFSQTGIDNVATITQLKAYNGTFHYVWVSETGIIYKPCSPCTADEVTIFAGTKGRKWGPMANATDKIDAGSYNTQVLQNTYQMPSDTGNRAPVVEHIADQTMRYGTTWTVSVIAHDPDGDSLTITYVNLPTFATITHLGNGHEELSFSPGITRRGNYLITAVAEDQHGLRDSTRFGLIVNSTHHPTFTPVSNVFMTEGDTVEIPLSATVVSGSISFGMSPLAFALLQDNGDGTGLITLTPNKSQSGVYRLSVGAVANLFGRGQDIFIVVKEKDRPYRYRGDGYAGFLEIENGALSFKTSGVPGKTGYYMSPAEVFRVERDGSILMPNIAQSSTPVTHSLYVDEDGKLAQAPILVMDRDSLDGVISGKQDALESGVNIKTVNGNSILGSGDIPITFPGADWGDIGGSIGDQVDLQSLVGGRLLKEDFGDSVLIYVSDKATHQDVSDSLNKLAVRLPQTKQLTADDTNNNSTANTWEDVEGLSFPVKAGKSYEFKFTVWFTAAVNTTGSRWSVAGSSTPTRLDYYSQWDISSSGLVFYTGRTSFDDNTINVSATSMTASNRAIVEGRIVASADDTIVLRFASEISNSAITAKAKVSTVTWTQLD